MTNILAIADARAALRLPTSDTSNDPDLTATYIPAVDVICESVVGPVLVHAGLVATRDGGRASILLPTAVASVQSVVESGSTLNPAFDYVVNATSGVITRGNTTAPFIFLPGVQNVVVTYTAGTGTVPANVKLAARIILAHLWQADQQGGRQGFVAQSPDGVVLTPAGYAIPKRAYELLVGSIRVPGFA